MSKVHVPFQQNKQITKIILNLYFFHSVETDNLLKKSESKTDFIQRVDTLLIQVWTAYILLNSQPEFFFFSQNRNSDISKSPPDLEHICFKNLTSLKEQTLQSLHYTDPGLSECHFHWEQSIFNFTAS